MELGQVLQALRNADAAGDTEAAKRLAEIAKQLMDAGEAPAAKKPESKKESGILASASKGLESLISSGRTTLGALTGDPNAAARAALERGRDIESRYADEVGFDRVREAYEKRGLLPAAGEVLSQIPKALAEQAPNIATTLGSARLGAMAGSAVMPGVGTVVGGLGGALAPGLIQMFGSNVERQAAEQERAGRPINVDVGAAGSAALPQAALDVAGTFIPLGGRLVSKLTGIPANALFGQSAAQAAKLAEERLTATLLKGGAKSIAAEVPTEVVQQMLERAQAGLPLTTPDALKEYGETAYQVSLLAPIGAAGRLAERGGARQTVEEQQAAEQRAAAEEEMRAEREAKQAEARQQALQAEVEEQRKSAATYPAEVAQQYEDLTNQRKALREQIRKIKKGSDTEFADIEHNKTIGAQLKEVEAKLRETAREYNRVRPALDAQRAQEEAAAAEKAKAEAAEIEQYRQAALRRQTEMTPGFQAEIPGMEQVQGPMAPPETVTPAPKEFVDYAQQIRTIDGQMVDLQTRAQQTTNLDEKVALNKQYAALAKAKAEAERLQKAQAAATEPDTSAQIAKLKKRMAKAEELGDMPTQAKLAAQLKELGVTDLKEEAVQPAPVQGEFDLEPFKSSVESRASFAAREFKPGAADIEAQEQEVLAEAERQREEAAKEAARERKIAPEILALRRIKEGERPAAAEGVQRQGQISGMVDRLVDAALRSDGKAPGRVVAGAGAAPLSRADALRGELALARATDNRPRADQIAQQLKELGEPEVDTGGDLEAGQALKEVGVEGRLSPQAMAANRVTRVSQAQMSAYDRLVDYLQTVRESDQNIAEARKQTLRDAAERLKDSVVGLALTEMDARRAQAGMPELSPEKKIEAVRRINGLLDELISRSAGVFNVKETPAVTRGTLTLKGAKEGAPPAGQRLFGNMAMASNALRGQVRDVIDQIGEIKAPEPRTAPPTKPRVSNELRMMFSGQERSMDEQFTAAFDRSKSDEDYRTLKDLQRLYKNLSPEAQELAVAQARRVELGQSLDLPQQLAQEVADLRRAGQSEQGQAELFPGEDERGVSRATAANFQRFLNSKEVQSRKAKIAEARKQAEFQAKRAETIQRKLDAEKKAQEDMLAKLELAKNKPPVEAARERLANVVDKNAEAVRIAKQINEQRFTARVRVAAMVRQLEDALAKAKKKEKEIEESLDYIVQKALTYPRNQKYAVGMAQFLDEQTKAAGAVRSIEKALAKARDLRTKVLEEQASNTIDNALLTEGAKAQRKIDKAQQELKAAQDEEASAERRLNAVRRDEKGKPSVERTVQADGGVRTVAKRDGKVIKDVTRYTYVGTIADEPAEVRVERDNQTGKTEAYQMVGGRPVGSGFGISNLVAGGTPVAEAINRVVPDAELEFKPARETTTTRVFRDTSDPEVQRQVTAERKNIAKAEEEHAKAMTAGDEAAMAKALEDVEAAYNKVYEILNNAPVRREEQMSKAEAEAFAEYEAAQRAVFEKTLKLFEEKAGVPPLKLTERRTVASVKNVKTGRIETQFKKESVAAQEKRVKEESETGKYPARALEELAKARAELKEVQDQIAYIDANPAEPRSAAKARQKAARTAAVAKRTALEAKIKNLSAAQKAVVAEARIETQAEKALKKERRRMLRNAGTLQDVVDAAGEIEAEQLSPTAKGRDRVFQAAATASQGPKVKVEPESNLGNVMDEISATSQIPLNRIVAERLRTLLTATKVNIVRDLRDDNGNPVYGSAKIDGSSISLDAEFGTNEQTVLHEGVHAAVERVLRLPEDQLTEDQRAAKRELEALYEAYKKDKAGPNANARESVSEFVAEALSDNVLQDYLQTKKWTLKNMWNAVKNGILHMLGVKVPENMRDAALAAADRLMMRVVRPTNADMNLAVPSVNRPVNPALRSALAVSNNLVAKDKPVTQRVFEENSGLAFATRYVDRFAGFERLAKVMPALQGQQMLYFLRMYDQRMNFVSQSAGNGALQLVKKTRKDGEYEYVIESVEGPSLRSTVQILKEAKPLVGNVDDVNGLFTTYLAAKRAERVGFNKLSFGRGLTEAKLKQAIADIESVPGLKSVFDRARNEYNKYNEGLVRFAQQSGALSKETADALLASKDYIPYYRQTKDGGVDLVIGGEAPIRVGSVKDQPYLSELVGGEEPIFDFFKSSVQNTNLLTDMALRNLATKNAVMELVDLKAATFTPSQISGRDVVQFKIDGKDMYARIDTDSFGVDAEILVKGMEGIPLQLTGALRVAALPARFLRKAITLNPMYVLRQLFRDSVAAAVMSGADFAPVYGALREIGRDSGKTLERRGITGGQMFTGTQEDISLIMRELTEGSTGFTSALAKLEAFGMQADSLTRRAQYNSYIKQGLSEMEATLAALESMNFNKRGASPSIHATNAIIPFVNAQIQGLNALYRTLTGKATAAEKLRVRTKMFTRGAMIVAATLYYAASMQDDEAYQNATPDQKYGNWFIRVPGLDEPVRLPIPFEVGYIFKALPEALYNAVVNGEAGREDAKDAMLAIMRNIIPGGSSYLIPQIAKPAIEVALGKSFFTGRDILSVKEQGMMPEQQFRDNTSEIAKALGDTFGVSPIKMEALINGYTGALGIAFMQALNPLFGRGESPEKAMRRLSDMPVVGTAFQPNDAGHIINRTYEAMQDVEKVKNTVTELIKKGERAKALEILQKNSNEYAIASAADWFSTQMTKITQYETAVKASDKSPEEKRRLLDEARQAKIKLAAYVKQAAGRTEPQ